MQSYHGKFVWYELMAEDAASATTFYKTVVGWDAQDSGMPGMAYTILTADGTGVGGVMAIPDEARAMGARPCWLGYIAVGDVDAALGDVATAGGSIKRAAADIPGVGRFAVVADPGGAVFVLFTPQIGMPEAPESGHKPGHTGWHELRAADLDTALAFYAGQFGWAKAEAIDMGPMGIYQLFAREGLTVGGMMTKTPETPMPHWLFYFNVDGVDRAAARVTAAGGKVLMGPMQVPGGGWILQGLDPQGALFALTGPKD